MYRAPCRTDPKLTIMATQEQAEQLWRDVAALRQEVTNVAQAGDARDQRMTALETKVGGIYNELKALIAAATAKGAMNPLRQKRG